MSSGHRRSARAQEPELYLRVRKRLLSAREEAGMTQTEAAAQVGRSQSFIAKCESGERRVDIVELIRFAKLYGKKLRYFIDVE